MRSTAFDLLAISQTLAMVGDERLNMFTGDLRVDVNGSWILDPSGPAKRSCRTRSLEKIPLAGQVAKFSAA
jgi:hypothetical protein